MIKGCTGKVRHRSHEAACVSLRKVKNKALNVYRCDHCGFWHLGNSRNPYRVQQRLDQIFKGLAR